MVKQNNNFDEKIFRFYQYLEYRLELENEGINHIINKEISKPNKNIYKREKKQPAPSYLL